MTSIDFGRVPIWAGLLSTLLLSLTIHAMYLPVEVQQVPTDRLIANLEEQVKTNPKDAQARLNLARAYGMAYAQKTATLPVGKGREQQGVWFGYEPNNVPFAANVAPASNDAMREAAKAQIAKAIERFKETIELAPTNLLAKLGYAWCLDRAGNTAQAITAYRNVIAEAWERDRKSLPSPTAGAGGRGFSSGSFDLGRPITAEAIGYLMPLLNPDRDRDEIATLRDRANQINRMPRAITPIAIPLKDGMNPDDIPNRSARVAFDADGSGLRKTWTWINPTAGWLVYAPDRAKPVSSALQMFGSVTFWLFWENGYDAMRALDDNHDGSLSGAELAGLAIWQDSNVNGIEDAGEVKALVDLGIVALSCANESTPAGADHAGDFAAVSPAGVTFAGGRTRRTYDVLLHERPDGAVISQLSAR